MTHFFDNDDDGYSRWRSAHLGGFVGNMTRTKTPTYFKVHRSTCSTITPGSSRANHPGAHTAGRYRKACSEDLRDLVFWAEQKGFNEDGIEPCGKCMRGESLPVGSGKLYPDEVVVLDDEHHEGAVRRVLVNSYERSAAARAACLREHGYRCAVCELQMQDRYGEIGREFVHVHHLVELSRVGAQYVVDPVGDLRPVCPNCHAMLHRQTPSLSIEDLRGRLRRSARGWEAPRLDSDIDVRARESLKAHAEAEGFVQDRAYGDGGTEMLFMRLQRAVMNQVDVGSATPGRYGIWAMTCRDHIAAAAEKMEGGDTEGARRLLRDAANSLSAFAAVQALVDPHQKH